MRNSARRKRSGGAKHGGKKLSQIDTPPSWHTLTMLAALTLKGMQAPILSNWRPMEMFSWPMLNKVLCPTLQAGRVVIMDNLGAHKVDGISEMIEATGARLIYLPPYSPDFNPIEQAWSKIKQLARNSP